MNPIFLLDEKWQEIEMAENKRMQEKIELEDEIFRIKHPILTKIVDIKDSFAFWLARF